MDAVRTMQTHRIGAIVVLAPDGALKGIMSEREVISALTHQGTKALEKSVRDFTPLGGPVVALVDSIGNAAKIMTEHRARHLPAISGPDVVGLISIGDVVKARLFEKIAENAVLQDVARWPRPEFA